MPCSALGDIGADESAILRCILNTLGREGIKANIEQLSEPIHLSAALKLLDTVQFTASARVKLSIIISLPCGPLRPRLVEFLVVDQDMDELLLRRPLLRCLGFDLGNHLEKIRTEIDNAENDSLMLSSLGVIKPRLQAYRSIEACGTTVQNKIQFLRLTVSLKMSASWTHLG